MQKQWMSKEERRLHGEVLPQLYSGRGNQVSTVDWRYYGHVDFGRLYEEIAQGCLTVHRAKRGKGNETKPWSVALKWWKQQDESGLPLTYLLTGISYQDLGVRNIRIWPTVLKSDVICMFHGHFLLLKTTGTFLFHYILLEIKEIFHMECLLPSFKRSIQSERGFENKWVGP